VTILRCLFFCRSSPFLRYTPFIAQLFFSCSPFRSRRFLAGRSTRLFFPSALLPPLYGPPGTFKTPLLFRGPHALILVSTLDHCSFFFSLFFPFPGGCREFYPSVAFFLFFPVLRGPLSSPPHAEPLQWAPVAFSPHNHPLFGDQSFFFNFFFLRVPLVPFFLKPPYRSPNSGPALFLKAFSPAGIPMRQILHLSFSSYFVLFFHRLPLISWGCVPSDASGSGASFSSHHPFVELSKRGPLFSPSLFHILLSEWTSPPSIPPPQDGSICFHAATDIHSLG